MKSMRLRIIGLLLCSVLLAGCTRENAGIQLLGSDPAPMVIPVRDVTPRLPKLLEYGAYEYHYCNVSLEELLREGNFNAVTELWLYGGERSRGMALSLKDLSVFPNLQILKIYHTTIADLHAIAEFANLHTLVLSGCDLF